MKSRKLVKILGASGLAIMMGIGTLCGVLIAPVAGATASSNAGDLAARAQLGDSALSPKAQAKAELDANILSGGGLGLDPENDPVVATTDWGLDIQFHNAGEGTWKSSMSTSGTVSTEALKGYLYFQGGTYGGVALKWVIIGYSTNTVAGPIPVLGTEVSTLNTDSTDAGNLIKSYASRGQIMVNGYKVSSFTNAVGTTEIPAGCVLCISEKNLLDAAFTNSANIQVTAEDGYHRAARWKYSDLRTTMSNLCKSGIASFDTIRSKIQSVEVKTYATKYNGSSASFVGQDTSTDTFFPLGNYTADYYKGSGQGFDVNYVYYNPSTYPQSYLIETYLGAAISASVTTLKRVSYTHNTSTAAAWWSRTGYYNDIYTGYEMYTNGRLSGIGVNYSYGVRPAFVLQL